MGNNINALKSKIFGENISIKSDCTIVETMIRQDGTTVNQDYNNYFKIDVSTIKKIFLIIDGHSNTNHYINYLDSNNEVFYYDLITIDNNELFTLNIPDNASKLVFSIFTDTISWDIFKELDNINLNILNDKIESINYIQNLLSNQNDLNWNVGYFNISQNRMDFSTDRHYYILINKNNFDHLYIQCAHPTQCNIISIDDMDTYTIIERWSGSNSLEKIIDNNGTNILISITTSVYNANNIPTLSELLNNITIKFIKKCNYNEIEYINNKLQIIEEKSANYKVQMIIGLVTDTNNTTRIRMKNVLDTLNINQTISLIDSTNYRFAVYYNNNILDSTESGWKSLPFSPEQEYSNVNICIRKSDNSAFDFQTDSDNLLDYVSITNFTSKEIHLSDDEIVYIKNNIQTSINLQTISKWNGKKAAFIGDSITYGAYASIGSRYYEFINTTIGFSSMYVNAISGRCWSITSNYGDTKTPIASAAASIPNDCDLIVIFAGTNDFGHNTPLGTINDTTDISFYGAMYKAINDILNNNPDVRIVLLTPLHRVGGTYYEPNKNGQNLYLSDYVNAIKEFATLHSIPVIDLYNISGLDPKFNIINTTYFADGLHPNDLGHERLGDIIDNLLEFV